MNEVSVWTEDGQRRQCQDRTEAGLADRLEKVAVRLAADAPGLEKPGADLIAYYLSPGPAPGQSAVVPQARRYPAAAVPAESGPVIGPVACEDIKVSHMQAAVNAAPTAGEGDRVRRCISDHASSAAWQSVITWSGHEDVLMGQARRRVIGGPSWPPYPTSSAQSRSGTAKAQKRAAI